MVMLIVPHMSPDFSYQYFNVLYVSRFTTNGRNPRQILDVQITKKKKKVSYSMWQMKNNQKDKMRPYISDTKHLRVCVKGIVSCHAFG